MRYPAARGFIPYALVAICLASVDLAGAAVAEHSAPTHAVMGMPSQTQALGLASPEFSVTKFINSLNNSKGFYFDAADWVYGIRDYGYYEGPQLDDLWLRARGRPRLELQNIRVLSASASDAIAKVTYIWKQDDPAFTSPPQQEVLRLKLGRRASAPQERCWQIVPTPLYDLPPQTQSRALPVLQEMAARVANPGGALTWSRAQLALSNLRQLAVRVRFFATSHHNQYIFGPGHARQALDDGSQWRAQEALNRFEDQNPLLPHFVEDNPYWSVPGTGESYAFNANLCSAEADPARWLHPARIVLFYDGTGQVPRFRYAGSAAIGFADGHVEMVSRAQAAGLIWKPAAKTRTGSGEPDEFLVDTHRWSAGRRYAPGTKEVWTAPQLEPDEVVRRYVNCLNHARSSLVFAALDWVAGAHYGYYGNDEIDQQWAEMRGDMRLKIRSLTLVDRTATRVTAQVTYVWSHIQPDCESDPITESLALKTEELGTAAFTLGWKLAPITDFSGPPSLSGGNRRSLRFVPTLDGMAAEIANVPGAVTWWRASQSRNRLTNLSMALEMFDQDFDEANVFGPEEVQTALQPYLETARTWEVPGAAGKYAFNSHLCGLSPHASRLPEKIDPDWVVAFYEGSDEKPLYRHGGQALVAFMDGRIAFIKPEDAGKLVWNVK